MIYVVTGEPYHDNSHIIGATTDLKTALEWANRVYKETDPTFDGTDAVFITLMDQCRTLKRAGRSVDTKSRFGTNWYAVQDGNFWMIEESIEHFLKPLT